MPADANPRTVMVDTQVRPSDVTKFPIIDAMLSVPREAFVPQPARSTAYADTAIRLGDGRSMLEPRTLAKMLDALAVAPNDLVLVVGAGLGYSAALLASMAEAVVALEEDAALADDAQAQLSEVGADNVAVVTEALAEGAPALGPFDAILVDGAVERLPDAISDQLKEGGRIVALFMSGALGTCRIGLKSDGRISWRDAFNAASEILPGFRHETVFQL